MINDIKTEFLLIGTRQQLAKINTACSITVGEYDIDRSFNVVRFNVNVFPTYNRNFIHYIDVIMHTLLF